MQKLLTLTIIILLSLPGLAVSSEVEEGQRLFHDKTLGTNAKSCASCHAEGKGLQNAGEYTVEMLQEFMNFCIRDSMKGEMLPSGDPKLVALEKYVRTFYQKK